MAIGDIVESVQRIVEERLADNIITLRSEIDPFIGEFVFPDSGNVVRDPRMGRNWEVRKVIELGNAGAGEYDDINGNNILSDSAELTSVDNFTLYGESAVSVWPGMNESPAPAYAEMDVKLKRYKGNLFIPTELIRIAELGASIGSQLRATIRGNARNVDTALCNSFWTEKDSSTSIRYVASITVGGGGYTIVASGAGNVVALNGGQIRRLYNGFRCDIYSTAGVRQNAAGQAVFVDNVNPLKDEITLKVRVGAAVALTGAATYWIVPRKSNPSGSAGPTLGASGLPDFIKASGTIGSGTNTIALTRVPELRSYIASLSSAALTRTKLAQYLARITTALGQQWGVDTLVAPSGVWVAYFESTYDGGGTPDSTATVYRLGKNGDAPLNIRDGYNTQDMSYAFDGRTYKFRVSPWAHRNNIWGLKTGERNFKLLVPPRLAGSQSGLEGSQTLAAGLVEFTGPVLFPGLNAKMFGVFSPTAPVAAPTNFLQMPYDFPHEIWPDKIPGLQLTSVADSMAAAA